MLRTLAFTLVGLGSTSLVGADAPSPAAVPVEAATALDPIRLAQRVCGRGGDGRNALAARLRMASEVGQTLPPGRGFPLSEAYHRTQVPASGVEGPARAYFDQGMTLAYGFNHAAALRSFAEARRLAPDCAMCWWGEALANGPNINAGMDDAQNRAALAALGEAREALDRVSPLERELIEAQILRYSESTAISRAELDAAYADAMLGIARRHTGNDDVAVLAAEAAMNTSPWNYWGPDKSQPLSRIDEAVALIEGVMSRNPRHPQAAHLYIHLMENSANPAKAEAAADRLAQYTPAGVGHLVHMPGHIYYRIGRYRDSIAANLAAARADEEYLARAGGDGLYRYGYYPHNVHFLLTSAQMVGAMGMVATETERLKGILNVEVARQLPWVQAIHAAPSFALAQYGSADAILALTAAPSELGYVEAMRHYARAIAYAERQDEPAFAGEIRAMETLRSAASVQSMVEAGFPAPDIIALAVLVAKGREAHWGGRHDEAIGHFEAAERIEPTIPYSEPPYWYYPVAQSRGAALYSAGRHREAAAAFRKALVEAPNSGWALYGLKMSHRKLGHAAEETAADAALKRVWMGDEAWLRMKRL
jgi:tetratricopeptide (TPR) repeat protein